MARRARVVVPGHPHHVTQRGNRRQQTFFRDEDYLLYLQIAAECFAKARAEVWSYCLMPNHVHLIAVPSAQGSLALAVGETHKRYTRAINKRERWSGFLWQGRFASFPMDEAYFITCARYVGLNPVRAQLVAKAKDWPWSSVRAHCAGVDDALARVSPLLSLVRDMEHFFSADIAAESRRKLRMASLTGRPLGAGEWVKNLEKAMGRPLAAHRRGRPATAAQAGPAPSTAHPGEIIFSGRTSASNSASVT